MSRIKLPIIVKEPFQEDGGAWIEIVQKDFFGWFELTQAKISNLAHPTKFVGYSSWDDEVRYVNTSDLPWLGFLRWKDVQLHPNGFMAPSLKRLQEALTHVVMCERPTASA